MTFQTIVNRQLNNLLYKSDVLVFASYIRAEARTGIPRDSGAGPVIERAPGIAVRHAAVV